MARRTPQLSLSLKPRYSWGGARRGAGRKRVGKGSVMHRARPVHSASHPVHVTLRIARGVPSLRTRRAFSTVRRALAAGRERVGFRLVHFSVMSNHLHLIVEGSNSDALARGI